MPRRDFSNPAREQWLGELRARGEWGLHALAALKRLVEAGCHRDQLIFLLMDLHQTLRLVPMSRTAIQRVREWAQKGVPMVVRLENSPHREELGLDDNPLVDRPEWSLSARLTAL